jgi:hypothetical protein
LARRFTLKCRSDSPSYDYPTDEGVALQPELFGKRLIYDDKRRTAIVLFRKCAAS